MLKKIKNDADVDRGFNSLPYAFVGNGFLLKPLYSKHIDNTGHFLCGLELFYYGVKVHDYSLPCDAIHDTEKLIECMQKIADSLVD